MGGGTAGTATDAASLERGATRGKWIPWIMTSMLIFVMMMLSQWK
jgi:hypothetical protein